MRTRSRRRGVTRLASFALLALLLATWLGPSAGLAQPQVHVGVVIDGPWERNEEIYAQLRAAIDEVVGRDFELIFSDATTLVADHTAAGVQAALDAVLSDPEVDFVLALGIIAGPLVCQRSELPKPVIAPYVLGREVLGLPFTPEGTSGVPNLNYIAFATDLPRELSALDEVIDFETIAFLVNRGVSDAFPAVAEDLVGYVGTLGYRAVVIPVGRSADEALAAIPDDVDAVYLAPLIQLGAGELGRLLAGLEQRRLPSFSVWGRSEVEQGVLMSIYRTADFDRLHRRVALHMLRILRARDPAARAAELPVPFARGEHLSLNMATARAIGVSPPWTILTEAELIQPQRIAVERELDLYSVVGEALVANLDLLADQHAVDASAEDIASARSVLLPQLELSAVARFIDADRAEASFGSAPQFALTPTARLTQILYAEPAQANLDVQQVLYLSREEAHEELRLDIVAAAATTYLNVLTANTLQRIQQDNLALTRSNLELARIRESIGVSGPADVVRWEAQIANNRQAVIEANALRNQAEIALNQLLNRPAEEPFLLAEINLDDAELTTNAHQMAPYLSDPASFREFRQFMVEEAMRNSPELRQLDRAIEAQERALSASERAFYVPTFSFFGEISYLVGFGEGTESGFEAPPDLPFELSFPEADDLNWTLGVSISYDLFNGGGRQADRRRAEEQLVELRTRRDVVATRVEQRVRSALHEAGASYAGIALAREAAEAARQGEELVSEAYESGLANITDLLDAQNQALVADLVAASAVYEYLIDYIAAQRAVGRFDMLMSDDERADLIERLEAELGQAE